MLPSTISHYRVLKRIGERRMGEVYLAEDTTLGRKVALKFLPHSLQQNEPARKLFLREAQSAASLDHPFICTIHEAGEADGKGLIAMEYIEGQTLANKLLNGPLPVREVLRIAPDNPARPQICSRLRRAFREALTNVLLVPRPHA